MKRVALFFGSFNPIHNGHIHIAHEVLNQKKADEVQFVLSPQNPFKDSAELWPENHRWEMLTLALAQTPGMSANAVELELPKPSYTATTLKKLVSDNPSTQYILLLGADSAASLPAWKHATYLSDFSLLIYPRTGSSTASFPKEQVLNEVPMQAISATAIRTTSDMDLRKTWLPAPVLTYIQEHRLLSDI